MIGKPRSAPLLEVRDLSVVFDTRRGRLTAVDRVSFSVAAGEILGVVGESGAGKSLTGTAITGLLERPGRIGGGEIRFEGGRIDNLPPERMRRLRGRSIAAIFQDPLTSLNPLFTVGRQLVETIQAASRPRPRAGAAARSRAAGRGRYSGAGPAFRPLPAPVLGRHAPAGGDRAGAVRKPQAGDCRRADHGARRLDPGANPRAPEDACREHGAAVILVTHDMGVIAETADRVAVMYSGPHRRDRPGGPGGEGAATPLHRGADGSIPVIGTAAARLTQIEGSMPRLTDIPAGCAFHPRCPRAMAECASGPARAASDEGRPGRLSAPRWRRDMTSRAEPLVSMQGLRKNSTSRRPGSSGCSNAGRGSTCARSTASIWTSRVARAFSLVGESGCGKSTIARSSSGSTGRPRARFVSRAPT